MTDKVEDFKVSLPPPRSGFITGKCGKCGKTTFSKGKINKHKCQ